MIAREQRRYFIKKPQSGRKSYQLICYYLANGDRKRRSYIPLSDDLKNKVDHINSQFLKKIIDSDQVVLLLKELISKEYKSVSVQSKAVKDSRLSEVNERALKEYWQGHYETKTKLKDRKSPEYDLRKALSFLGSLSIYTAAKHEIERQVFKQAGSPKKAARAISRLNEMLSWLGRKGAHGGRFILDKPDIPQSKIQYVRAKELDRICENIDDVNVKALAYTLFSTGLRIGEALALDEDSLRDTVIFVRYQIDRDGNTVNPKRGSSGQVVVIPAYIKKVEEWIKVTDKLQYRYRLYEELHKACRAAYPKGPDRLWIGTHDLRHSHAIYLLESGATITQVAHNLRNGEAVCRKYYTGFAHTEGTLELLKRQLKAKRA